MDVAYEYNINSDAPTDPLNLLADANSLVAYVYDYGGQATAPVPGYAIKNAEDPTGQHYHYILNEDGTPAQDPIAVDGTTTYVTFQSDRLPLVRPRMPSSRL